MGAVPLSEHAYPSILYTNCQTKGLADRRHRERMTQRFSKRSSSPLPHSASTRPLPSPQLPCTLSCRILSELIAIFDMIRTALLHAQTNLCMFLPWFVHYNVSGCPLSGQNRSGW